MLEFEIRCLPVGEMAECCYIVFCPSRSDCVVIDPGAEAARIRAACEGRRIAAILLTHAHADHIGAVEALRGPDTPVYIHTLDNDALGDVMRNVSAWLGQPMRVRPADRLVADGDRLALAGITFEVLHTPGHTAGSVCYLTEKAIFTGDTVLCGSHGRTDLPTGSDAEMAQSLARLQPLLEKLPYCGGHT